jgi:hypothetical protein
MRTCFARDVLNCDLDIFHAGPSAGTIRWQSRTYSIGTTNEQSSGMYLRVSTVDAINSSDRINQEIKGLHFDVEHEPTSNVDAIAEDIGQHHGFRMIGFGFVGHTSHSRFGVARLDVVVIPYWFILMVLVGGMAIARYHKRPTSQKKTAS